MRVRVSPSAPERLAPPWRRPFAFGVREAGQASRGAHAATSRARDENDIDFQYAWIHIDAIMLVCHCERVNDRTIRKCAREGARNHLDVALACGAGSRCGGCRSLDHAMLSMKAKYALRALCTLAEPGRGLTPARVLASRLQPFVVLRDYARSPVPFRDPPKPSAGNAWARGSHSLW